MRLVDGMNGGAIGRIHTEPGSSKVLFGPDGTLAYVNHIKSRTVSVISVVEPEVIGTIPSFADAFSDMMISADGLRLWVVHKMVGKTSIIGLLTRTVVGVLDTGAESNHPIFAIVNGSIYSFVTVAATNETKVYSQDCPSTMPLFVTSIKVSGIEPHGIWGSLDETRIYWGNEHSDTMDVADTSSMRLFASVPAGQESQVLVYVAGAVPAASNDTENLGTQGQEKGVENHLINVTNSINSTALITIGGLNGLDIFHMIGRDLEINQRHVATAICTGCGGKD
ncbi:uncharacterized protein LY89DRAFT_251745 [Mollisia scopiformis]|uniref:Uncharacterized protein n=1 Tax=Mollisia scopiformis TaxID=149040 RepID=A0A194WT76_MOLSC|nr:uncharacterized protein LY89DRAFT_251745 [Mollisia scopiformis]KUJ10874.1 hypothetical protein LY89DRAFT_251745 [Mollisia scopiformis]